MIDSIGVWSHAIAAILFTALAMAQVGRPHGGMHLRVLTVAFGMTAIWALLVMLNGPHGLAPRILESGRNLAWLGFMLALLGRGVGDARRPMVMALYGVLTIVVVGQTAIDLLGSGFAGSPRVLEALFFGVVLLRMTVAVGALVLVHNLYTAAAPEARWGIRLPMIALAAMWGYDLNVYTIAYLGQRWPTELLAIRGVLMVMLVPLFALASRRNAKWKMRLSRAATFQSLSLIAIGGYLVAMVVIARMLRLIGGDFANLAQITVVFGMSVAALLLLPSERVRAWLKVKVAKHLFQHRYDYRAEWMRFTNTLSRPDDDAEILDVRVVQAIADITESPGGLLLEPDAHGALLPGARWRWVTVDPPAIAAETAFTRRCEESGRIVELDMVRTGRSRDDAPHVPEWMLADPRAWAAVPLVHFDRLAGIVLLERPRIDRRLDWEDFDLLRVAGRQAASYLAEARGQAALGDARRFDEFNRRFAFIMHDIKNIVSQLSLLTRNAERHADNPEFRADMIATLRASVGKMNDLLARLSQHSKSRPEEPRAVPLRTIADTVARARPMNRTVRVEADSNIVAQADRTRLEQALTHLVQNAIDASGPDDQVSLRIYARQREAVIEIIDHGHGMSADFVRNQLFKPFNSTKQGGFGIGAFEARALIAGMGGRLEVESREGEGSRFIVVLPMADAGDAMRDLQERKRA